MILRADNVFLYSAFAYFFAKVTSFANIPIISTNIDEGIILIFLIFLVCQIFKTKRIRKLTSVIIIFLLTGIFFSLNSGLNTETSSIFIQSIRYAKYFIFFLLIIQLQNETISKFMRLFLIYSYSGAALNLILGDFFYEIYELRNLDGIFSSRLAGFHQSPNLLGLSFVGLYFYFCTRLSAMKRAVLLSMSVLGVLLTSSTTALLIFAVIYCYKFLNNTTSTINKLLRLASFTPVLLVALIISSSKFSHVVALLSAGVDSGYARAIILVGALSLATTYFPVGAGFGTFATPSSRNSSAYDILNLNETTVIRNFLSGSDVRSGIYDSNLAIFLGELGFVFGILAFYLYVCIGFYRVSKSNYVIFSFVLFAIFLTKPIFMQFDFFFMLLSFIYTSYNTKAKHNDHR